MSTGLASASALALPVLYRARALMHGASSKLTESNMQTSKIKVGEVYGMRRGSDLVRFQVTSITSRKTMSNTTNSIQGFVVEDRKDGKQPSEHPVEPSDLLGPYAEQAALVERKAQEDAARKSKEEEAAKQARADRLALYEFIGVTPPKDATSYNQLFQARWGSVDMNSEGKKAIVARVHQLREGQKKK